MILQIQSKGGSIYSLKNCHCRRREGHPEFSYLGILFMLNSKLKHVECFLTFWQPSFSRYRLRGNQMLQHTSMNNCSCKKHDTQWTFPALHQTSGSHVRTECWTPAFLSSRPSLRFSRQRNKHQRSDAHLQQLWDSFKRNQVHNPTSPHSVSLSSQFTQQPTW